MTDCDCNVAVVAAAILFLYQPRLAEAAVAGGFTQIPSPFAPRSSVRVRLIPKKKLYGIKTALMNSTDTPLSDNLSPSLCI